MFETNKVISRTSATNSFYNSVYDEKDISLTPAEKDYIYLAISKSIEPKDWKAAYSVIHAILKNGKVLQLNKNSSAEEKLAYPVLAEMLSNLGSGYSADPRSANEINKALSAFCVKEKVQYSENIVSKDALFSLIKSSAKTAADINMVGERIDAPLKLMIKIAARGVFKTRESKGGMKTSISFAIENVERHINRGFKISHPTTESERITLEIYAELFRILYEPKMAGNFSGMTEGQLIEKVKQGLAKLSMNDSSEDFLPVYQRKLLRECVKSLGSALQIRMAMETLLNDLYSDDISREATFQLLKSVITRDSSVDIYIHLKDKETIDKIGVGYLDANGTIYNKTSTNDPFYHVVSYLIAYIYGMEHEDAAQKNIFVNGLYSFCKENGMTDKFIFEQKTADDDSFNVTLKVDQKLLTSLLDRYYGIRQAKREKISTEKKILTAVKVKDPQYLADISMIVAMKCILVARLGKSSELKEELLTPDDIRGIITVFARNNFRNGLKPYEIEELEAFAIELEKGTYQEGKYSVKYMGKQGHASYAISSLQALSGKSGSEDLYDRSVSTLSRIGWQLQEISPQEDPSQYNILETVKKSENQKTKLSGAELQLIFCLKAAFYKDKISDLKQKYEASKENNKDDVLKGLSKSEKEQLQYYCSDKIDKDFWNKIDKQFPNLSNSIDQDELFGDAVIQDPSGKTLQFPYSFERRNDKGECKTYTVKSFRELISTVLELDGGWGSLTWQPGEGEETSLAKKSFSLMIYNLGMFSKKGHRWLANIVGAIPAAGSIIANAVIWTSSALLAKTNALKTETGASNSDELNKKDIFNSEFQISGVNLGIVNQVIKYFDKIAENPNNTKTNMAPYVYMLMLNMDQEKSIDHTLEILTKPKDVTEKFSTLRPEAVDTLKNIVQNKILPFINSYNVESIVNGDKELKKMKDEGIIQITNDNGKPQVTFDYSKLDKFRDKIRDLYNGKFSGLYFERLQIPVNIREEASYTAKMVLAVYSLIGTVKKQLGQVPSEQPITADEIKAGWIKEYGNNTKDIVINRYSKEQDIVSKEISDKIKESSKTPLEKIESAGGLVWGATKSTVKTSIYFATMQIYFMEQYKNWIEDLIDAVQDGDMEKFEAIAKQIFVVGVQVLNFSYNPWAPIAMAMKYWKEGKPEEAVGMLIASLNFSIYVLSRDIAILRNLWRGVSGRPRVEVPYGFWDLPIKYLEKGLLHSEDWIMKRIMDPDKRKLMAERQEKKEFARGSNFDKGLEVCLERLHIKNKYGKGIKKIVWDNIMKTEFIYKAINKTGKGVAGFFDDKYDRIFKESKSAKELIRRITALNGEIYEEAAAKLSDKELIALDKLVIRNYHEETGLKPGSPSFSFSEDGEQASFELVGRGKKPADILHQYGNPTAMYSLPRVQKYLDSMPRDAAGLPVAEISQGGKAVTVPIREISVTAGSEVSFKIFKYEGAPGIKVYIGADAAASSGKLNAALSAGISALKGYDAKLQEVIKKKEVSEVLKQKLERTDVELKLEDIRINGRDIDVTIDRINGLEPEMRKMTWSELLKFGENLKSEARSAVAGIEEGNAREKLLQLEKTVSRQAKGDFSILEARLAQSKEVFRRLSSSNIETGDGAGQISKEYSEQVKSAKRFCDNRIAGGKNAMAAQLEAAIVMLHDLTSVQADPGEGKTVDGALAKSVLMLTGEKVYSTAHDRTASWQLYEDTKVFDKAIGIRTEFVDSEKMSTTKIQEKFRTADVIITTQSELNFMTLNNRSARSDVEKIPIDYRAVLFSDEFDFIIFDLSQTPHITSSQDPDAKTDKKLWKKAWRQVRKLTKECFEPDLSGLNAKGRERVKWDKFSLEQQHRINQCVKAVTQQLLLDYKVNRIEDKIQLLSRQTGLVLENNEFEGGLQQAIQAKEGVEITPETRSSESVTMQECLAMYRNKLGMSASLKNIAPLLASKGIKYMVLDTNVPRYSFKPELSIEDNIKAARKEIDRAAKLGVNFENNILQIEYSPEQEAKVKQLIKELSSVKAEEMSNNKPIVCTERKVHQEKLFGTRLEEMKFLMDDMQARVDKAGGKQGEMKPVIFNVEDARYAFMISEALKNTGYKHIRVITFNNEEELRDVMEKGLHKGEILVTTLARRAVDIADKSGMGILQYVVDRGSTGATQTQKIGRAPRFGANGEIVLCTSLEDPIWFSAIAKEDLARIMVEAGNFKSEKEALESEVYKKIVNAAKDRDITYRDVVKEVKAAGMPDFNYIKFAQAVNDDRMFVNEFITDAINTKLSENNKDLYERLNELQAAKEPTKTLLRSISNEVDRVLKKNNVAPDQVLTKDQMEKIGKDLVFLNKDGVALNDKGAAQGARYTGEDLKQAIIKTYEETYFTKPNMFRTAMNSVHKDWNGIFLDKFNETRRAVEKYKSEIARKYETYLGEINVSIDDKGNAHVNADGVKDLIVRIDENGKIVIDVNKLSVLSKMVEEALIKVEYDERTIDLDILRAYDKANRRLFGILKGKSQAIKEIDLSKSSDFKSEQVKEKPYSEVFERAGVKVITDNGALSRLTPEQIQRLCDALNRNGVTTIAVDDVVEVTDKMIDRLYGKLKINVNGGDRALLISDHDGGRINVTEFTPNGKKFKNYEQIKDYADKQERSGKASKYNLYEPEAKSLGAAASSDFKVNYDIQKAIEKDYGPIVARKVDVAVQGRLLTREDLNIMRSNLVTDMSKVNSKKLAGGLNISVGSAGKVTNAYQTRLTVSNVAKDGLTGLAVGPITSLMTHMYEGNTPWSSKPISWGQFGNEMAGDSFNSALGWGTFGLKRSLFELAGVTQRMAVPWVIGFDSLGSLANAAPGTEGFVGVSSGIGLTAFLVTYGYMPGPHCLKLVSAIIASTGGDIAFKYLYTNSEGVKEKVDAVAPVFKFAGKISRPAVPSYWIDQVRKANGWNPDTNPDTLYSKFGKGIVDAGAYYYEAKLLSPLVKWAPEVKIASAGSKAASAGQAVKTINNMSQLGNILKSGQTVEVILEDGKVLNLPAKTLKLLLAGKDIKDIKGMNAETIAEVMKTLKLSDANAKELEILSSLLKSGKWAGTIRVAGNVFRVAGNAAIVLSQVASIISEFNKNWDDLMSNDPEKVAKAQTKISMMAAGGFLVDGAADLVGLAVGAVDKEAGKAVGESYEKAVELYLNSPQGKVLGYTFMGVNWVNSHTWGEKGMGGLIMDEIYKDEMGHFVSVDKFASALKDGGVELKVGKYFGKTFQGMTAKEASGFARVLKEKYGVSAIEFNKHVNLDGFVQGEIKRALDLSCEKYGLGAKEVKIDTQLKDGKYNVFITIFGKNGSAPKELVSFNLEGRLEGGKIVDGKLVEQKKWYYSAQ